jgi:hypothetical protein
MTSYTQVANVVPRIRYSANGVQTAFGFGFPVFDVDDLEVWVDQTLQSHGAYSVSGVGVEIGGTVIFTVPPPPSTQVTLRRRMALKRDREFTDTQVEAWRLNNALYYQMAALQQVADEASLAVKRSFRSLSSADLTLPEPAAGRAIRWNDDGNGLVNSAAEMDTVLPQAIAQAQAASASASAALASQASATAAATHAATSRDICDADVVVTGADRAAVAADKIGVAADRAAVHADRLGADASAAAASLSEAASQASQSAATLSAGNAAASEANALGAAAAASASQSSAHASELSAAGSASAAAGSAAAAAAAASAAASGGTVKVSATDTTLDHLSNSLVAGSNIGITTLNPGANETLRIAVTGLAAVANSGAYSDLSGRPTLGTAAAFDVGTTANKVIQLDAVGALPAVSGANLTGLVTADLTARDQIALTNLRLMISTSVSTGVLVFGKQWELSSDEWASGSNNYALVPASPNYYGNPGVQSQVPQGTGTAFGNMTAGTGLSVLFDGNTNQSAAQGGYTASGSGYAGKDWGAGTPKVISGLVFYGTNNSGIVGGGTGDTSTVTVSLYGSNSSPANGTAGTLLGSGTVQNAFGVVFSKLSGFDVSTAYRYHWAYVSGGNVATMGVQCAELQFHTSSAPSNMTLTSPSVTLSASPSYADCYFLWKDDGGSAVLGTDLTVDLSRDGGATYTAAALTNLTPGAGFDGTYGVIRARANVGSQPSGTSLKARIMTHNTKSQRVAAPSLYVE